MYRFREISLCKRNLYTVYSFKLGISRGENQNQSNLTNGPSLSSIFLVKIVKEGPIKTVSLRESFLNEKNLETGKPRVQLFPRTQSTRVYCKINDFSLIRYYIQVR